MPTRRKGRRGRRRRNTSVAVQKDAQSEKARRLLFLKKESTTLVSDAAELFLFIKRILPKYRIELFTASPASHAKIQKQRCKNTVFISEYNVLLDLRYLSIARVMDTCRDVFISTTGSVQDRLGAFKSVLMRQVPKTATNAVTAERLCTLIKYVWEISFHETKIKDEKELDCHSLELYCDAIVTKILLELSRYLESTYVATLIFRNEVVDLNVETEFKVRFFLTHFFDKVFRKEDEFRGMQAECSRCKKNDYACKARCGVCNKFVCNRCRRCLKHIDALMV